MITTTARRIRESHIRLFNNLAAEPREASPSRFRARLFLIAACSIALALALIPASALAETLPSGGCSDEQVRQERGSLALPDCRAYELVTPPAKNGALIHEEELGSVFQIASDGRRVITSSYQCFDDAPSCIAERGSQGALYEFARAGSGWAPRSLAPPAANFETSSFSSVNATAGSVLYSAPSPPAGQEDFYAREPGGAFVDVGPLGEGPTANFVELGGGLLASADLSHIVYTARQPFFAFDPTGEGEGGARVSGGRPSLYEYSHAEHHAPVEQHAPLLVDVKGGFESHEPVSHCGAELGGEHGALSEDGRIVYFTSEDHEPPAACPPVKREYARVDGESADARTVLLSTPTPGTCDEAECLENTSQGNELERARKTKFQAASDDGSRMLFTSGQQLTDNASESGEGFFDCGAGSGCNLYESECVHCDELTGEQELAKRRLIDVSEGAKDHGGPRVQGVVAVSADATYVYFVAKGVLTGEEQNENHEEAVEEADNLYVYAEGHVAFVTVLSPSDERDWKENSPANVTPDGRFLVIPSRRALTADDTRVEGPAQVFEYDAAGGRMTRISVGDDGFNADGNEGTGDATIVSPTSTASLAKTVPFRLDPTMSDDGSAVFFESPIALTPGALNDVPAGPLLLAQNVYEFRDGRVFLISDGKDTTAGGGSSGVSSAVELLGIDPSGANVFFTTFDPLLREDADTQRDIYDARICNESDPCLPLSSGAAAACEGEACHGTAPGETAGLTPGSQVFSGPGNAPPPPAVHAKRKTAAQIRADGLAKALKSCRKKRRNQRGACERKARRAYGAAGNARRFSKDNRAGHGRRAGQ